MIFNTIKYIEFIQNKLDSFDKLVKQKHNELNPDYPMLVLSQEAEYILAHKQEENPEVPEEIRVEIQTYLKESDKRVEAIKEGKIIIPELETEELNSIFEITKEDLAPFIESKDQLLELFKNGKES